MLNRGRNSLLGALAFVLCLILVWFISRPQKCSIPLHRLQTSKSPPTDIKLKNDMRVDINYLHMEPGSFRLFAHHVTGKRFYLEWGAGGSTQMAPFFVTGRAYTIEHNVEWCKKMVASDMVVVASSLKKIEFECVDTGATLSGWSDPVPGSNLAHISSLYLERASIIRKRLQSEFPHSHGVFDVVLVDGRFRIACALYILLNSMVNENSIVIIHDFYQRAHYTPVLQFYDILEGNTHGVSAVVLAPKRHIDITTLQTIFDAHKLDPR